MNPEKQQGQKRGRWGNDDDDNHPMNTGTETNTIQNIPTVQDLLDLNFEELARIRPEFRAVWKNNNSLHSISQSLSACILQHAFSITMVLEPGRLCPPIPNRYFYVRWIIDDLLGKLLQPFPNSSNTHTTTPCFVVPSSSLLFSKTGLDIGVGASGIYCLLIAATTDFKMYGTDIDPTAIQSVHGMIIGQCNPHLASSIGTLLVEPSDRQQGVEAAMEEDTDEATGNNNTTTTVDDDSLLLLLLFPKGPFRQSQSKLASLSHDRLAFCLTNPPFFDIHEDRNNHHHHPSRTASMTEHEGYYPEGEAGFVYDMIVDGLYYKRMQQFEALPGWMTCMCGKKTTVKYVTGILRQLLGFSHVVVTEFGPGHLTRWFVAWTFEAAVCRSRLAVSASWMVTVPGVDVATVATRLCDFCASFRGGTVLRADNAATANTVTLTEPYVSGAAWSGDASLPDSLQAILRQYPSIRDGLAPAHCLVDCQLSVSPHNNGITIHCTGFAHTVQGKKTMQVVQGQLIGEIARSNRRWRRKLQREQG